MSSVGLIELAHFAPIDLGSQEGPSGDDVPLGKPHYVYHLHWSYSLQIPLQFQ